VYRGAAVAAVGASGMVAGVPTFDATAFAFGGIDPATGAETNAVMRFSGRAWAVLATTGSAPSARKGAVAVYAPDCGDGLMPGAAPRPCVVVVGGDARGVPVGDVFFLWVAESPARWERVAAAQAGAPIAATGAAGALSADGSTVVIFGGTTAAGVTNDVWTFAFRGYPDFTLREATNLALNRPAFESTTDPNWGAGGPGRATDGNLQQLHDNGPPLRACSHTLAQDNPWWKVDLGAVVRIDAITYYPRNDCCTDRNRDYVWRFGANNDTAAANPPVPPPLPAIGGNAVNLTLATPMWGRFFWVTLPGTARALAVCELQLWRRLPYVWRRLSGTSNVALGKPATQSSIFTGGNGGSPSFAVDGIATNLWTFTPSTCTHTENTGVSRIPWLMVDLGREFDVSSITLWPRTDCCPERNRFTAVSIGYSRDLAFNPLCPGIPTDLGTATGGRTYTCPLRGRFAFFSRVPQPGETNNLLTICEFIVMGRNLLDEPSPRSGMAYTSFRGNLFVYGGNAADGFRVADSAPRMFDMTAMAWVPPMDALGSPPAARSLTHLLPLPPAALAPPATPSSDILVYAGAGNAEALTDASILSYPACPPPVLDGVLDANCTAAGTVCLFRCMPGFADRNRGRPTVCQDDGTWSGFMPPCGAAPPGAPRGPVGAVPASELGVALTPDGRGAAVSYTAPASLGYYALSGVSSYRVEAVTDGEYYEEFTGNDFRDPAAWGRLREFPPLSNNHFFAERRLWLDAAAGSDYWLPSINFNGFNAHNIPSAPLGPYILTGEAIYRGLGLHRSWPAEVDPSGPWVFDAFLEAGLLPANSQVGIGLTDVGTCPFPATTTWPAGTCSGHLMFFVGVRRNVDGLYPFFDVIGSGILQNTARDPAVSSSMYLRIEYSPTGAPNNAGYTWRTTPTPLSNARQRWSMLYKYRAADPWIRHPFHIDNSFLFNGTNFIPPNFRPTLFAKQWNTALSTRSVSAFRYIRIARTACANPGCARTVPGSTLSANVTGLTPGATYRFAARASTAAGFGAAATTTATYTMPVPAPPAIPALVNAALNKPAWLSDTIWNDQFNNGAYRAVDGNWGTICHSGTATGGCTGGAHLGIDLGVDFAAVKAVHIWHRTDCCRER
jgi:hypothetical protein